MSDDPSPHLGRRRSIINSRRYALTNNREAGDAFHTAGWDDPGARGSSFTQDHALVGATLNRVHLDAAMAACERDYD